MIIYRIQCVYHNFHTRTLWNIFDNNFKKKILYTYKLKACRTRLRYCKYLTIQIWPTVQLLTFIGLNHLLLRNLLNRLRGSVLYCSCLNCLIDQIAIYLALFHQIVFSINSYTYFIGIYAKNCILLFGRMQ